MNDTLAFEDFRLDLSRGELTRSGVPVAVEPQVLDLIAAMARKAGTVLSRDDLIEAVWGGRIVSDSAISSRINAARAALGDDGTAQRIIKTIPRRGFRFEADVSTDANAVTARASKTSKPSIAVLPFSNMSDDPEQRYFSDGITDDIITDLSRYDEIFVSARHSAFAYRESALSTKEIARELGVDYIAEGSVRRAANRIRVTVQLMDPVANQQLWAERYDRDATDIFAVQDEVTALIVNTLVGHISHSHYRRVLTRGPETVDAYDHTLKAAEHALRVAPEDNALARAEAEAAIRIDPGLARAHAIRALTFINEANNLWVADQMEANRKGFEAAKTAVAADNRDPWAHAMLGIADLWLHRAFGPALQSMRRAIELNPSSAYFRSLHSYVLSYAGHQEEALAEIDAAIRMNPLVPSVFLGFRGRALLLMGEIEEGLTIYRQMVAEMPGHSNAIAYCAVGLVHSGQLEEARAMVAELAATHPTYRLRAVRTLLPFARPEDTAFIADALEKAGLPEE